MRQKYHEKQAIAQLGCFIIKSLINNNDPYNENYFLSASFVLHFFVVISIVFVVQLIF